MGEVVYDSDSSINVMYLSTLNKFEDLIPRYTSIRVYLANGASIKHYGKVENVIVQVGRLKFHTNFIILEMDDEKEDELLLGRRFLSTANEMMDFQSEITIIH